MPVVEHAASIGYLFKMDPRLVLDADLPDQVILAALGVAIARLIEEARKEA